MYKPSRYFLILLVIFIIGCKKEKTGPSIYNFSVVDDYTSLPLSNCSVILKRTFWPYVLKDTVIGNTNSNGEFCYTCDKYSDYTAGYYDFYEVGINKDSTYYGSDWIPVTLSHTTSYIAIRLKKKNPLQLFIQRITPHTNPNKISLLFDPRYISFSCFFNTDTLNKVYHIDVPIPSKTTITISWEIYYWDNVAGKMTSENPADIIFNSNYNDTTYYYLQY